MNVLYKNKKEKIKGFASGQILVESMVALAITVIGLLGLLSLLSNSIGINKVVSDQYVGSYLASEGVEVVKNIIDNNVASGNPFNQGIGYGDYEVGHDSTGLALYQGRKLKFDSTSKRYSYQAGADTPFIRKITISQGINGQDELVVHSNVTWKTRGGAQNTVDAEDHFFNWRQ